MDVTALVPYLRVKLRRSVDVVPPKKDDAGEKKDGGEKKDAGGDNKEKAKAAAGGDKKEGGGEKKEGGGEKKEGGGEKKVGGGEKKEGGAEKKEGGGGEPKMEVSKMEHHGYAYPLQPMYWPGGHVHGAQSYAFEGYPNPQHHEYGYVNHGYMNMNQGYNMYPAYANHPLHAPQMFSDENPNACSVM